MSDWKVLVVAGALLAACGGSDEDTPADAGTDTDTGGTGDVGTPDAGDPDTVQPDAGEPDADAGDLDIAPDAAPDIVEDVVEPDVNDATDGSSEPDVVVPPPEPSSCVEVGTAFEGEDRREVSFDGEGRLLRARTDYGFGGYDEIELTYDEDGRVLTEKSGYSSGTSEGFESLTTYVYTEDAPSMAATFTESEDSNADGTADRVTTGTVDSFGRTLSRETRNSEDTLTQESRYTYLGDEPDAQAVGEYQDYDGNGVADFEVVATIEGGLVTSTRSSSGEVDPLVTLITYSYDDMDREILRVIDEGEDEIVDSRVATNWVSDDESIQQSFEGAGDVPNSFRREVYAPGTALLVLEQTLVPAVCSYTQYEYNEEGQIAYEGGTFAATDATDCVSIVTAGTATPTEFSRIEYGGFGPTREETDLDGDGVYEEIKVTVYLEEGYIELRTITSGESEPTTENVYTSTVTRDDDGRLLTYMRFDNGSDLPSIENVLTYDENGRVATRSETTRFGESSQTYTYAFTYDDDGRITEEVRTSSFDETPVTTTTTYVGPFPFDTCRSSDLEEEG